MWFKIDPSNGLPIYMQILNQVKRAVAGGMLNPGDQLPSVRELAVQLTVDPNTIAKAYQELEREGVIKTLRGRGTFVAEGNSVLKKEARLQVLTETIERVLVEAHHLRINHSELQKIFLEKLRSWSPETNEEWGEKDD
ncbi:MAG: GntR family transcriptional regulator [Clostridia bacterium]|nr:GntR family transcriptional regulator [Clostridia bacterium]